MALRCQFIVHNFVAYSHRGGITMFFSTTYYNHRENCLNELCMSVIGIS